MRKEEGKNFTFKEMEFFVSSCVNENLVFFDEKQANLFFDKRETIMIFLAHDSDLHHNEQLQVFQHFSNIN